MLLFKAESAAVAEAFARADPYVVNSVVQILAGARMGDGRGAGALTKV